MEWSWSRRSRRLPMGRCSSVGMNPTLPDCLAARISSALPTRTTSFRADTSASIMPTSAATSSYSTKDISVAFCKAPNTLEVVTVDQPPYFTASNPQA